MNDIKFFKCPFLGNITSKTLFLFLILLIMYDFISTYIAITYFINLVEQNPLINYMSFKSFLYVKLIVTFIGLQLCIIMYKKQPYMVTISFIILIILYTIVFINNTYNLGCAIYD